MPALAAPVRRLSPPLPVAVMQAPGARQREEVGLVIAAPHGTRIGAAAAGTVAFAGLVGKRGNTVVIRHDGGIFTVYCHLDAIAVVTGAAVKAGGLVGTVGMTGGISTPRLYLEVRKGRDPVDPLPYF
ncbi:murein hydrolase activator EnvC family protein [Azospirillum thiophilum]|uniref:murein hydrolase activator EnvC family protein n=1 Tax=Azospirillum thiophilum TaxID=528244 RepID=UPI001187333C|nr:M23 family metallopeptidase [Azospirillum thiophilum]